MDGPRSGHGMQDAGHRDFLLMPITPAQSEEDSEQKQLSEEAIEELRKKLENAKKPSDETESDEEEEEEDPKTPPKTDCGRLVSGSTAHSSPKGLFWTP